jgi:hypothetical protein
MTIGNLQSGPRRANHAHGVGEAAARDIRLGMTVGVPGRHHENAIALFCALQHKIAKEAQIFYPPADRKGVTTADNRL